MAAMLIAAVPSEGVALEELGAWIELEVCEMHVKLAKVTQACLSNIDKYFELSMKS